LPQNGSSSNGRVTRASSHVVETPREPIDAAVTVIIRQAKDGTHRHFELTDDIDAEGYVIALELPDEP
jgi:hypothetical protein